METFIQYAYAFNHENQPATGRAMHHRPYYFFRRTEEPLHYSNTSLKGHRFDNLAVTACLKLEEADWVWLLSDWLEQHQGSIMMGGLRRHEPTGTRVLMQQNGYLHFTLVALCADDMVNAARALREFLPVATEAYRRERLRK